MTFNVGDRVRARISSGPGPMDYHKGREYEVTTVYEGGERILTVDVEDHSVHNGWCSGNFELVAAEAPTSSRAFSTGATRDTDEGKLDYEGFLSPLVLKRYAEHMHAARKMPDGTMRASDNWQLGIPKDVYMKSMFRHFFDVWDNHRNPKPSQHQLEAELCALLFNVSGMLHEILKAKPRG
jgi:hypothetical protein